MIEGPLKADGRLAAKNAVKIRAALTQVTNFKAVFERYQETHPQKSDNRAQDRARARAWLIMNVGFNNDALHNAVMMTWAEAYVLGQDAADYWIKETYEAQKAPTGTVNWDTWKPGDRATALLIKPVGGFKRYLEWTNAASYFKNFDKETLEMLGTSLADSIEAGFEAETAALHMKNYVGSASRALTIAITEQSRALAFSSIQRYKEGGIEKIEWNVADPCPICAMNAGVVVQIGQTFPSGDDQPPAHPHCKCRPIPVVPGMEEDNGIDGSITSPTTTPEGDLITEPFVTIPTKSNAGKNIEHQLAEIFKTTKTGALQNKQIAEEIFSMQQKDIAAGGAAGDAYLTKIADMQGFTGKPNLVNTVEELINKQKNGEGIIVWRGLSDFSKDVADGILETNPKISYTAKQAVSDFMTGDYRSGWGSFGSGTYTTTDLSMAKEYAQGVSEGQMGNGQVMAMLLPKNAIMPTEEVVKQTFKEIMDNPAFDSGYNIGRALAAKGYQAYDVGFLQEDKKGIYVILDRSMLTVAKETR